MLLLQSHIKVKIFVKLERELNFRICFLPQKRQRELKNLFCETNTCDLENTLKDGVRWSMKQPLREHRALFTRGDFNVGIDGCVQ